MINCNTAMERVKIPGRFNEASFFIQGVGPTSNRAAIICGVELPAYDIIKKYILLHNILGDTEVTHFM